MYQQRYNTPYQLKLPVDLERKIEIFDPVYTFCEVIDHIDLRKYLTEKDSRLGRKRYDEITLRSRARGFESLSLRHFEPKIVDFGLFFFQFYLIFDFHSPLSRKTPFAVFMPSITFLQGYARQLQGWSKTPHF